MQQHLGKIICVLISLVLKLNFVGVICALIIGHLIDRKRRPSDQDVESRKQERQALFFITTFQVMGHLSKAKGVVTEQDIQVANVIMDRFDLEGHQRQIAQNAFREGKNTDFPLRKTIREFRLIVGRRIDLLKIFLEIQLQVALSDGTLHEKEKEILLILANELGLSSHQFENILNMLLAGKQFNSERGHYSYSSQNSYSSGISKQQQLADAYCILGVDEHSDSTTIKRAYRKLMSEHHPDKLVAKGLPQSMMDMAKEKAQAIQAAYELIKSARGFK